MQADIVHDQNLAVRVILWQLFVVRDEDCDFPDPDSCPQDHTKDLNEDGNYVQLLLLSGVLHDFNEHADRTNVQNYYD